MTIEELIDCDADRLEKMTDAELLEHLKQYLDVTRPERQPTRSKSNYTPEQLNPKLAQGMNLLKGLGVDIGDSLTPYKRKKK